MKGGGNKLIPKGILLRRDKKKVKQGSSRPKQKKPPGSREQKDNIGGRKREDKVWLRSKSQEED